MERGLYGQAESNAGEVNASAQRFADVEGEGLRVSSGEWTEQGYRVRLRDASKVEIDAQRAEARVLRKAGTPDQTRSIEARGYVAVQKDALQAQGEIAEEMLEAGFGQGNVFAALKVATPMVYAQRETLSTHLRGAEDPTALTIRTRRKSKMYNPERDGLESPEGVPVKSQAILYAEALAKLPK